MKRGFITLFSGLFLLLLLPICETLPPDPFTDPKNVIISIFEKNHKDTVEFGQVCTTGVKIVLAHFVYSLRFRVPCDTADSTIFINSTDTTDTAFFLHVFKTEGQCSVFVSATLHDTTYGPKSDTLVLQVIKKTPTFSFTKIPSAFATQTDVIDTLIFVASPVGNSEPSIFFTATCRPVLDFSRFHAITSDDTCRVIFIPDHADTFAVKVTAMRASSEDSALVNVTAFKKFALAPLRIPDTLVVDKTDTLAFIAPKDRPDALRIKFVNKADFGDTTFVKTLKSTDDSLVLAATPLKMGIFTVFIAVTNGAISDTICIIRNIIDKKFIQQSPWTLTQTPISCIEGKTASLDIKQFLKKPIPIALSFSSDIGTINADTLWQWMPQWGCDSVDTAFITAKKDTTEYKLQVKCSIKYGDSLYPAIRLVDTTLLDKKISFSQKNIEAVVIDKDAGVKEVLLSYNSASVIGTLHDDSVYSGAISGLKQGEKTEITLTAKDKSMRGNSNTIKLYLTYDSTMQDNKPPIFAYLGGPKTDDRIVVPIDTLVYGITDNSGVDSVFWTLNGSFVSALQKQTNSNYLLPFELKKFNSNRITIIARDGSVNHDQDSIVITLMYNTKPGPVTLSSPLDNEAGIDVVPVFSWTGGDDPDGDTVYCRVFYGTSLNDLSLKTSETTGKTVTLSTAEKLKIYTKYYWKVIAYSKVFPDTSKSALDSFSTKNAAISITKAPASLTVNEGDSFTLSVTATGAPAPITYQWYRNDKLIANATSATYKKTNTKPIDAGQYYVVVSNDAGDKATSANATVTVLCKYNDSLNLDSLGHYDDPALSYNIDVLAKRMQGFWKNHTDMKVVFLGSSHTYYGIDPNSFTMNRVANLAIYGGPFYVAKLLITQYLLNHSPSLRLVGCDFIPATMNWTNFYLPWSYIDNNIGFNYDQNHCYWKKGLPNNFEKLIALAPCPEVSKVDTLGADLSSTCEGWGGSSPDLTGGGVTWSPDDPQYQINYAIIKDVANQLYLKKVHFLMYITPESPYYKNTNSYGKYGPNWQTAEAVITRIKALQDTFPGYFHFYDANLDGNHDYTDSDASDFEHLCPVGAQKMSGRMDSVVTFILSQ
jgi:hypothetical protein